jgi:hypothetical protein
VNQKVHLHPRGARKWHPQRICRPIDRHMDAVANCPEAQGRGVERVSIHGRIGRIQLENDSVAAGEREGGGSGERA